MQLSRKPKMFSQLVSLLLKSTSNVEHFQNKDEPHSWCILQIIDFKKYAYLNG